jgi:hypothetical protein
MFCAVLYVAVAYLFLGVENMEPCSFDVVLGRWSTEIYQKMEETSFSETSVDIDKSVRYHNPEDHNQNFQRCENLKYDTSCSFVQNNIWVWDNISRFERVKLACSLDRSLMDQRGMVPTQWR